MPPDFFASSSGGNNPSVPDAYASALAMQAQALSMMLGNNSFQPSMMSQNSMVPNPRTQNMSFPQVSLQNSSMAGTLTGGQQPNGMQQFHGMQPSTGMQQSHGMQQFNATNMSAIWADAMKMSLPVGTFPNDENLLIQALHLSVAKGQTYRQALDGLHGTNNHAANLWKDYYLDHSHRINNLLAERRASQKPHVSVKKPSPESVSQRKLPSPSYTPSERQKCSDHASSSRSDRQPNVSKPGRPPLIPEKKQRRADGSSRVSGRAEPRRPSRSPTPPTTIVQAARGAKYTRQDKEYLVKYIQWRVGQDSSLTRTNLCDELEKKVPHHSAGSWQSHWGRNPDAEREFHLAVKNSYRRILADDQDDRRPNVESDAEDEPSDESDGPSDSEDDEENMGGTKSMLTPADKRVMARYIASIPDWESLTDKKRWVPFEEMYIQRTAVAWAEHYRKYASEVGQLVRKYQRRKMKQRSVRSQARKRTSGKTDGPSSSGAKRRRLDEDVDEDGDEDRGDRSKRSRD